MTPQQAACLTRLYRMGYKPHRFGRAPDNVIIVWVMRKLTGGTLVLSVDRAGVYKHTGRDYRFETLRSDS